MTFAECSVFRVRAHRPLPTAPPVSTVYRSVFKPKELESKQLGAPSYNRWKKKESHSALRAESPVLGVSNRKGTENVLWCLLSWKWQVASEHLRTMP